MKRLVLILSFAATVCHGQAYKIFKEATEGNLRSHKSQLKEYYRHFQTLLSKRDTVYLEEQLSGKADRIYIIEGYNFETGKYSIFEEHRSAADRYSEFYLDKEKQPSFTDSYFLYDTAALKESSSFVDTIFPRKYRYGAGCVYTDSTDMIFATLVSKAKQDGVVIEKYCRIETYIDNNTGKIGTRYYFPVKGQREFESRGVGMLTDYPPGLDFWLFTSMFYVEK